MGCERRRRCDGWGVSAGARGMEQGDVRSGFERRCLHPPRRACDVLGFGGPEPAVVLRVSRCLSCSVFRRGRIGGGDCEARQAESRMARSSRLCLSPEAAARHQWHLPGAERETRGRSSGDVRPSRRGPSAFRWTCGSFTPRSGRPATSRWSSRSACGPVSRGRTATSGCRPRSPDHVAGPSGWTRCSATGATPCPGRRTGAALEGGALAWARARGRGLGRALGAARAGAGGWRARAGEPGG